VCCAARVGKLQREKHLVDVREVADMPTDGERQGLDQGRRRKHPAVDGRTRVLVEIDDHEMTVLHVTLTQLPSIRDGASRKVRGPADEEGQLYAGDDRARAVNP
jgi:hypothetical protein